MSDHSALEWTDERAVWGQQLCDLARLLDTFGRAMIDGDKILGVMAADGLFSNFACLPAHIREQFTELLSDESARGFRTDQRYIRELTGGAA